MIRPLVSTDTVANVVTNVANSDAIRAALHSAAVQLGAHYAQEYGEVYRVEDLQQALHYWLELSIESLAEDALFHTLEGDRAYAFNRSAFEAQLRRLQPIDLEQSSHPVDERAAA